MQKTFRFFKWSGKKAVVLFVLTAVVILTAVNTTVAILAAKTRSVQSSYQPAKIEVSSWSYGDIINAGDTEVYARASLVAAWVSNDENKTVWATPPKEGSDYTLSYNTNDWFPASDGFYYHKNALPHTGSISFVSANQLTQKDGYTLRILVMYSTIQTTPKDAVQESWPAVKVADDGSLVPNN